MKIICKPCLALDALAAITFCNMCRNDIPQVKESIDKHFENIKISPADAYFNWLIEKYTLGEIENFNLQDLVNKFPACIQNEALRGDFLRGLDALQAMDFANLWQTRCLPVLEAQCKQYDQAFADGAARALLTDVQKLKPHEKIEDITVYLLYFTWPISFYLTPSAYQTNNPIEGEFNARWVLRLFAHELLHRFSNDDLRKLYRETAEQDDFFTKTKNVLFNDIGSPSDEEEFVVALDRFLSVNHGLFTEEEVYQNLFSHYDSCMPIAIITFNALMKYGEIPTDINYWISQLFYNGTIRAGEIENRVDEILPGFSDAFKSKWFQKQ